MSPINIQTHPPQSSRALPAHGPHAAHLVSRLRHRHHRQLLHRALLESKADLDKVALSRESAAPGAWRDTRSSIRSTPRMAAPFRSPPD
jgi:hypothetical protein